MFVKRCTLLATISIAMLAACGPVDENNGNNGSGNNGGSDTVIEVGPNDLDQDMTWEGTVLVSGNLAVNTNVTIEPCTTIKMEDGHSLQVREGGQMIARGTEDCPITFTSTKDSATPGSWRYVEVAETASAGNVFEHVVIEYAGASNERGFWNSGADVEVNHMTIRETAGIGLRIDDELPSGSYDNLTFENVSDAIIFSDWDNVALIGSVSASGSERNRIRLTGRLDQGSLELDNKGVPYEIANASIQRDLTVAVGIELLVTPGLQFQISEEGTMTVNGTEDQPVQIESSQDSPAAGDWRWIEMSNGPNEFTWTEVRHSERGFRQTRDVSIVLNNVTLEQNGCDYEPQGDEALFEFNNTSADKCE
jgi:hypothetical protein